MIHTDNFKIIYKILNTLEKALDFEEFDLKTISSDKLGISEARYRKYIEMLVDSGYIKGIRVYRDLLGDIQIEEDNVRITLKGLEYLCENTIMQRMYKLTKGIKDICPL